MNNKEQIICKYKFRNKEKFDGRPYCTCFCELCENLYFICEHNCQVYEDLKQLARKAQELEAICKAFDIEYGYDEETGAIVGRCNKLIEKEKVLEEYKQSLDEKNKFLQDLGISASGEFKRIKFYIEDLKNKYNEKVKECEELKEQLQANQPTGICETCMAKAILQNDKYHKALEEIEAVCKADTYTFADGTQIRYDSLDDILNIINKAKGERMIKEGKCQ